MYKHPEIDYQPQHPMLKQINETSELLEAPQADFFEDSAGKGGLMGALSGMAKKVSNAGASAMGYALKKDMTQELAKSWLDYYNKTRKKTWKNEANRKNRLKRLKEDSGGKIYSYDDSKDWRKYPKAGKK